MEQTKLQQTHYEIFGYSGNPCYEDVEHSRKLYGKTKKQALGAVKIMLDNFDCEHIAIFRVEGSLKVKNE